jgi:Calcineurin-like phosphoesterase
MRTFVVADAHGYPQLIQSALRHGGFKPGEDDFVYAGDLLDRGPDAAGCVALVESYATEVLLGNHDVAALLELEIYPQNEESPGFGTFLREKVLDPDRSRAWKVAVCVEGVLITHAGVSQEYQRVFVEDCEADPVRLAGRLNEIFVALVERQPPIRDWSEDDMLADNGLFWFRPRPYSSVAPLPGCVQVAGHTPPLAALEEDGFYMIDPCAWEWELTGEPGYFRYAIVEAGRVIVAEGTLLDEAAPSTPGTRPKDASTTERRGSSRGL